MAAWKKSYLVREGQIGMENVCFLKVWMVGKDLSGWGDICGLGRTYMLGAGKVGPEGSLVVGGMAGQGDQDQTLTVKLRIDLAGWRRCVAGNIRQTQQARPYRKVWTNWLSGEGKCESDATFIIALSIL